eukprot:NODE_739_length_1386_cov_459.048084.p1 GENE.NODE_739_length_1386_cov_459.048084~~NODE_739_length_1386_cov_459.048084.p1  ORF type:complete len:330 (-),score=45.36 NODE_739_length_1386_cov_459.048084:132-1121(-)
MYLYDTSPEYNLSKPVDLNFSDTSLMPYTLAGTASWTEPEDVGFIRGYYVYAAADSSAVSNTYASNNTNSTFIVVVDVGTDSIDISGDVQIQIDAAWFLVVPYNDNGDGLRVAVMQFYDRTGSAPDAEAVLVWSATDSNENAYEVSLSVFWALPRSHEGLAQVKEWAIHASSEKDCDTDTSLYLGVATAADYSANFSYNFTQQNVLPFVCVRGYSDDGQSNYSAYTLIYDAGRENEGIDDLDFTDNSTTVDRIGGLVSWDVADGHYQKFDDGMHVHLATEPGGAGNMTRVPRYTGNPLSSIFCRKVCADVGFAEDSEDSSLFFLFGRRV